MTLEQYVGRFERLRGFFELLPEPEWGKFQLRSYKAGTFITSNLHAVGHVIVVLSGVLNAAPELDTGAHVVAYRLARGDVCGIYALADVLSPQERCLYKLTMTAHTDAVCALVPYDEFLAWRIDHPAFFMSTCRRQMTPLYHSNELLLECSAYNPYYSMVTYLLFEYQLYLRDYEDGHRGSVRIQESRQDIANFLGVDVRSVNRVITKLKERSLVSVVRGKIHIDPVQYAALQEEKMGSGELL